MIAHRGPPHETRPLHALSPLQAIVQLVASLHSTVPLHASLPVHVTLHAMPGGHLMSRSHAAGPGHVNVQTSLVHVPPAFAQRASHVGVAGGGSFGFGAGGVSAALAVSAPASDPPEDDVEASGPSTSSTLGLSMHAAIPRTEATVKTTRIRIVILALGSSRIDAVPMRGRVPPIRTLLLPLLLRLPGALRPSARRSARSVEPSLVRAR